MLCRVVHGLAEVVSIALFFASIVVLCAVMS